MNAKQVKTAIANNFANKKFLQSLVRQEFLQDEKFTFDGGSAQVDQVDGKVARIRTWKEEVKKAIADVCLK